jgi:hypothetical protein
VEEQPGRVSRIGTARMLVLLGSGLQLAAGAIACLVVLVFGPVLRHRSGGTGPVVLAVVVFVVIMLAGIAVANLLALRARSVRRVLAGGCGTLLAGTALGAAALLVLLTRW